MAKRIAQTIKDHREWLAKTGKGILARDSKYLLEDLEEGTLQAFQQIPHSLGTFAMYYGILGTLEVLDGKESGWEHVSAALDFQGWELKIRAESFYRIGNAVNLTNYIGPAACLACVSEQWGEVAESILRRVEDDPGSVDQSYWKSRRFEPFVLEVCRIRNGEEPLATTLEAPYQSVIDAWGNSQAMANALEKVCDYHCKNMGERGGDWDPEFDHPPFDLLPCEVMFVREVHRGLGMPIPEVSHELVTLLSPPDVIPCGEEHEWISKVSKAFDQCFN